MYLSLFEKNEKRPDIAHIQIEQYWSAHRFSIWHTYGSSFWTQPLSPPMTVRQARAYVPKNCLCIIGHISLLAFNAIRFFCGSFKNCDNFVSKQALCVFWSICHWRNAIVGRYSAKQLMAFSSTIFIPPFYLQRLSWNRQSGYLLKW